MAWSGRKRNDRFRGGGHEKLPFLCLPLRDGMQPKPDLRDRWVAPLTSGEFSRQSRCCSASTSNGKAGGCWIRSTFPTVNGR